MVNWQTNNTNLLIKWLTIESSEIVYLETHENLEQLKRPIREDMELFEGRFSNAMSSKVALLNRITHYIVNRKGKQMRPMFVFLTAKLLGKTSERTFRAASVIELIHTATLVHDDVVDDSDKRRGFFSINALWKNKIAVLVGDYLLSKGLLLCIDNKDFDLLEIISVAVREMSEGELLQIEKARSRYHRRDLLRGDSEKNSHADCILLCFGSVLCRCFSK